MAQTQMPGGAGRNMETGSRQSDESMLGQAKEAAGRAASSASDYAQDAYETSARYVRETRERYPEADRYLRRGTRYVREPVRENPLLAMLVAGAIGYALAYLIHAGEQERESVPDYARTRTRYRWDKG